MPIYGLSMPALGLLLVVVGCNLNESEVEEEESPFDYSSLVAMVPDTFIRPGMQWVSSYRLPSEQYGFSMAFDGSDSTYWSTAPGLNNLEGFEWRFDEPLTLGKIGIKPMKGAMFAYPDRVLVYTDRGNLEAVPSGTLNLPDSIRWLKVVFMVDRNWSRVVLPLENTAFSSMVRVRKGFSTLFESKPLGISEIQMECSKGTIAPFLSSDGFSRITEQQQANQRFDLNDGRSFSSLHINQSIPERRIFYQFPNLRAILGFRLRSENSESACLQLAWHKPNGSSVFYDVNQGDWSHKLGSDTLATKNISFSLRLVEGKEISISEFDFWDGARWFRLQEDSVQKKLEFILPSGTTPEQWPLNKSILFDEGFAKKTDEALDWETERDASAVPTTSKRVIALFRSNGLFELLWTSETEKNGSQPYAVFSGNWIWNQGKLELKGMVWESDGVHQRTMEYTSKGNRLIPLLVGFPEFDYTY